MNTNIAASLSGPLKQHQAVSRSVDRCIIGSNENQIVVDQFEAQIIVELITLDQDVASVRRRTTA